LGVVDIFLERIINEANSIITMAEYDKYADKYAERLKKKELFSYNTHIEIPNMLNCLGNIKNKIILDLGCGFGDQAQRYTKRGAKKVFGFDISKKLVKIANERKIPNTEFKVGNLNSKLKYNNNSFDVVVASLSIHYVKNINQLFSEIQRVLKPKGIFCFSIPNPVLSSGIRKFNTSNYDFVYITGIIKEKNKKKKLYGDYFTENDRKQEFGPKQFVTIQHRTYQCYIRLLINSTFDIIDYIDCKPIPSSKKLNPSEFERCMKIPTFCIFKVKK